MRDSHEGLPEIINSYERDQHFFCCVAITLGAEMKVFEFGIDQESHRAVKRIFDLRPFEQFPGAQYRYFFVPRTSRVLANRSKTYCAVRIEQEDKGKVFEVAAPESLIANLVWFFKVKDFSEAAHLREIVKEG